MSNRARSTQLEWRCQSCCTAVTIHSGSAWPQQCPHCKTWYPVFQADFKATPTGAQPNG